MKFHMKDIKLQATSDGYLQLSFTGYGKAKNEYSVIHEMPWVVGYSTPNTVYELGQLMSCVLKEAGTLYDHN